MPESARVAPGLVGSCSCSGDGIDECLVRVVLGPEDAAKTGALLASEDTRAFRFVRLRGGEASWDGACAIADDA